MKQMLKMKLNTGIRLKCCDDKGGELNTILKTRRGGSLCKKRDLTKFAQGSINYSQIS